MIYFCDISKEEKILHYLVPDNKVTIVNDKSDKSSQKYEN